jgi:hypothetical protein
MEPTDFTFAMLAKAVADAGGRVHVSGADLIRMNNGYLIELDYDKKGGVFLTLAERKPLSTTVKKILQGEPIDGYESTPENEPDGRARAAAQDGGAPVWLPDADLGQDEHPRG